MGIMVVWGAKTEEIYCEKQKQKEAMNTKKYRNLTLYEINVKINI